MIGRTAFERPLRVAVIGVGYLGKFHARILSRLEGVQLVGVVDPVAAHREAVAKDCGTQALADWRPLIGNLDAAVVATPTQFHHDVGTELLARGVHLLIEKPLASTVAQADALVAAARQARVVLQVGHVERFNPALALVQPHLDEPKYLTASRLSAFKFRSADIGVVLDLMIHDIDLVLSLVRAPLRSVEALGVSIFGDHEDAATARLTFENGAVAQLEASRCSYESLRRLNVWTPRAFASIDLGGGSARLLRPRDLLVQRAFRVDALSADDAERLKTSLFDELFCDEPLRAEPLDQLTAELTDFVDSIRTGRSPRVPGEQGREALAVAQRVLEAVARHAWDGRADGRHGAHAIPPPRIVPAPHFDHARTQSPPVRREAG